MLRKRAQLVTQARDINAKADGESRSKSAEERAEFDRLTGEAENLGDEIAQRQRLAALEGFLAANGDRQSDPLPHQEERNLGKYSLLRAICVMADRGKLDGLEGEVSQELIKRRGSIVKRSVPANGFVMPYDLPVDMRSAAAGRARFGGAQQRAFDTTSGAGGIPTILSTSYIEILRNRMVVQAAGATVLTDMSGNFAIPRQNTASTMYWLSEGGAPPSGSQPTVDQVPFTPRTAGAYTDITRRLAEQINVDAEMFVRTDLAAVVARGVDKAALNGSGASNEPLGLLQNPAISVTEIGANGGPPTWDAIVAQETAVSVANADLGALSYVTNAKVRGKLKTTPKIGSTFPIYLWNVDSPDSPVNGYPTFVTNQLPSNLVKGSSGAVCSPMIFGNWNDLIIAFWSGQDVIVDPYTGSAAGTLRIVTLQDVDINVRHPESFNNIVDMTT